jgi:hypothetical protein
MRVLHARWTDPRWGLTARRVEIRVYFIDGSWEGLAVFRDVLDIREERAVEGLVVVFDF